MSEFFNIWSSTLTIIFLLFMLGVVIHLFSTNKSARSNICLHTFDGIAGNDAPIPRIIFWGYLTFFIGAVVYLLLFPGIASWQGFLKWEPKDDAYNGHAINLDARIYGTLTANPEANLALFVKDEVIVGAGKSLFKGNCAACHTVSGQGQSTFPNLTDVDWLYGGSDQNIYESILYGRHGVMPAWSEHLTVAEINNVTDYVMNINNSSVPNAIFEKNCVDCHGKDATGNLVIGAPNLTDNIWLHGGSKDDINKNIANGLNNKMPAFSDRFSKIQVLVLATYVRSINPENIATSSGSKELSLSQLLAGGTMIPGAVRACISCHGIKGKGVGSTAPKLAGLSAEYLSTQLHNFKNGNRINATMMSMASALDDKAIQQAADYFGQQAPEALSKTVLRGDQIIYKDSAAELVNQGDWSRDLPSCVTCHATATLGVDNFPRLAQQNAAYLEEQLLNWKQGTRKGDHDNMMGNIAKKLTDTEIKSIAQYLANME